MILVDALQHKKHTVCRFSLRSLAMRVTICRVSAGWLRAAHGWVVSTNVATTVCFI